MMPSAQFWDKMADQYAAKPIADEAAYQHKLSLTQSYMRPDMQVLEFGCGTGSTALVHAPKVAHYTAIDNAAKMISIARGKQANSGVQNLAFQVATLEDFTAAEQSYDMILGLSILHLLSNYQQVIQQAYDLLKPGGLLVTNTGCLKDHMRLLRYVIPVMQWLHKAPYVEFISRQELEQAMTSVGFTLVERWEPPKDKAAYFLITRKPD